MCVFPALKKLIIEKTRFNILWTLPVCVCNIGWFQFLVSDRKGLYFVQVDDFAKVGVIGELTNDWPMGPSKASAITSSCSSESLVQCRLSQHQTIPASALKAALLFWFICNVHSISRKWLSHSMSLGQKKKKNLSIIILYLKIKVAVIWGYAQKTSMSRRSQDPLYILLHTKM